MQQTHYEEQPETITALATIPHSQVIPAARHGGMLMPLATAVEAKQAIDAYEALKTAIVRKDDIQVIQGRDFLKKSFWRRIATCFGLSLELLREERLADDGKLSYRVMYKAIAPNGRWMDGDGYCSTGEKGRESWPEHSVRATAHTRAKNRAISDLVGGGEVSAEEMPDDEPATPASHQRKQGDDAAWRDLRDRAKRLGVTDKQWQARVKQLKTLDAVRAAIEAAEHASVEATATHIDEIDAEVVAAQQDEQREQTTTMAQLHMRAIDMRYSVAQWEALVAQTNGDPAKIAEALDNNYAIDLHSLGSATGVH